MLKIGDLIQIKESLGTFDPVPVGTLGVVTNIVTSGSFVHTIIKFQNGRLESMSRWSLRTFTKKTKELS